MTDNNFTITLDKFYQGASPAAHLNSLTEIGNAGNYSVASNIDILTPGILTQGPALSNLTAGTQAGAVSELINFIMDKAVSDSVTYGIGATKLFKITPSAVTSDGTFPHAITNCTDGESVIDMGGNLYYFYNKSSGGDIGKFDLNSTFDDDWGSTVPSGAAALQKAIHPCYAKEDIIVFGNGQYVGTYVGSTLSPTKLDFGSGNEVADIIFSSNQWLIAVNNGIAGTNRTIGQIYTYDGGALSSILADEAGVGVQRIGFIYELNGIIYIAYQDLSSTGGYKIGYLAGRQIKPLGYFTGSLPTFAQKTLYKHTILFISSGLIYSAGAVIDELPFQVSQLADGGYATIGALAAPFGTPMVASTDGATNYRLAKFSGFDTSCSWKSIVFSVSGKYKGYIDDVTVFTSVLGANARCDLTLECNQGVTTSNSKSITGSGISRHFFTALGLNSIEDFRVYLDFSNGSSSNNVSIRKILINGHYTET